MGHTICIGNSKGGVGKTTTAINLSAALAIAEKKTLLVDMDPQGHATAGMGIRLQTDAKNVYHALTGKANISEIIMHSPLQALNIIPANTNLFKAEAGCKEIKGKETLLRNLMNRLKGLYDYIVVDSPPSVNLLTLNAITAANSLLIPLQCEFFAMQGLAYFLKVFRILKKKFNPHIHISGILITMFCPNETICTRIVQDIRTQLGDKVFKTMIPRDTLIQEAALHGKSLLFHNIKSVGARSYFNLAKEIMTLEEKYKMNQASSKPVFPG